MKLVTLALVALCTASACAQSATQKAKTSAPAITTATRLGLEDCPVTFTHVALETRAHLMPVQQGAAPDGNLRFQYKNLSGKDIQSISVRAELKVKMSVYDLDATTMNLDMTLTGNGADETLPVALRAYGLTRVTLEQVFFKDGTIWNPGAKNSCSYEQIKGAEQIGKLQ